jgi:hypothetical protein
MWNRLPTKTSLFKYIAFGAIAGISIAIRVGVGWGIVGFIVCTIGCFVIDLLDI